MLVLLGCAAFHAPGPLGQLGHEVPETAAQWIAAHSAAGANSPNPPSSKAAAPANARASDIVRAAKGFLGNPSLSVAGTAYRFDCSGLVEASLAKAGIDESGSSAMLFDQARERGVLHHRRTPKPGDIAFFDDTYDRDNNGKNDDALSHSAVVVGVAADGTIDLVHLGSKGVVHLTMNLRQVSVHDADGTVLNDYLRAKSSRDADGTQYLAGELWAGFASFWIQ